MSVEVKPRQQTDCWFGGLDQVCFDRFELDLGAATLISSIDFVDIYIGLSSMGGAPEYKVTVCGRGTEEVVKTHRTDQSKFTLVY